MSERATLFYLALGALIVARVTLGYIRACLSEEDPKYVPPNQLPAFILGVKWLDFAPAVHFKNVRRWRGKTAPAATVFYATIALAVVAALLSGILNP